MADIDKNVLAALLVITIVISVFGTWITLSSMVSYEEIPAAEEFTNSRTGRVRVVAWSPPVSEVAGKVAVNLVNPEEGG